MTTAIIICAGDATRWNNHLGVAKHLLVIDGERLLDRTVRLALGAGASEVLIVAKPGVAGYDAPGARRVDAVLNPMRFDADKFLSSRHLWSATERTVVLYGDVWFDEPAMATIFDETVQDWTLFCRPGPSPITGATSGECFAIGFWPQHRAEFEAALHRVAQLHLDGKLKRSGGWETYRAMAGLPDNRLHMHRMHRRYIEINSMVEDFDYPRDYDLWAARRSRSVSVVVPFRADEGARDKAWKWIRKRWELRHPDWQLVAGTAGDGPWRKAEAVADAVSRADGAFLVIADADVWCDNVPNAIEAVADGAPWAIPYGLVHRLTERATTAVLAGGPLGGEVEQRPYIGVPGGGLAVMNRETYQQIPLDPRFAGWGGEDDAWGLALTTIAGQPWRGTAALHHLWHPPQERLNRRVGSARSHALLVRYQYARASRHDMQALLEETSLGV